MKQAVAQGAFREDLFYRLNVVPIYIPPLRERREDILPLALDFVRAFNQELKKSFTGFTPAAAERLRRYPWPGNIRELKNAIERTMILSPEGEFDVACLPEEIRNYQEPGEQKDAATSLVNAQLAEAAAAPSTNGNRFVTLDELEERYIRQVLEATQHNKSKAARILGIHPTSLMRRLKKSPPSR